MARAAAPEGRRCEGAFDLIAEKNLLFHCQTSPRATMFGWGTKSSSSTASTSSAREPTPNPPPPRVRTLESLIEEELPIQRHSVAMEGGMPSCLTLFDNFFLCYCQSPSPFPTPALPR